MEKYEHGGDIHSKKIRLDFSANINPLGMPQSVRKAMSEALSQCEAYPDPKCRKLAEKISQRENTAQENILCGNGAAELIFRTVYGAKPKKAMIVSPTFSEYERALCAADCQIIYHTLSEDNAFVTGEDILDRLDESLDMLFLCTPNNPTGAQTDNALLFRIVDKCREKNIIPVLDISFDDFTEDPVNAAELAQRGAVVIRALTKIYALAGIRAGYLLCTDKLLLEKIRLSGQSWSVNTPAQAAGAAAMEETDFVKETVEYISRERRFLTEKLSDLGIRVFPSAANFLLLKSKNDLCRTAEEYGIALRSCHNFTGLGKEYFRIAVRTHEENLELVNALKRGPRNG